MDFQNMQWDNNDSTDWKDNIESGQVEGSESKEEMLKGKSSDTWNI